MHEEGKNPFVIKIPVIIVMQLSDVIDQHPLHRRIMRHVRLGEEMMYSVRTAY